MEVFQRLTEFDTNFGDLAVLLPLVVVLGLWLLVVRKQASALWWAGAVGFCVGCTAVLKMYFYVCPLSTDLHSPSGHTSLSTLVYGALTLTVAAEVEGWQRGLAVAAGAIFVASIAISRILVQAHSLTEVCVGLLIGGASLWLFARAYTRSPPTLRHVGTLAVVCVALMVLLNGQELRAEDFLHNLAVYLNIARVGCA